jgi:hypothetical protein
MKVTKPNICCREKHKPPVQTWKLVQGIIQDLKYMSWFDSRVQETPRAILDFEIIKGFIWNLKHILTSCLRSQQTIQTFVLNLKNNPSFVKSWSTPQVSQPHFGLSVRMRLTLSKVGTWSPLGLPKTQSSIARVKTPCIKVFFISMERSWSLDVKNGLAWSIWTSAAQVMGKRKAGSQIGNLTPDH